MMLSEFIEFLKSGMKKKETIQYVNLGIMGYMTKLI